MFTSSGDEGVFLATVLVEENLKLTAGGLGGIVLWGLCFWPDECAAWFSIPAGCCGGTDDDLRAGVIPTVFNF
jgi:hypothetical protein